MAKEFKGLTVSFGANTTEFDKSVKGANKALNLLKKDFQNINKELRLDHDNVELMERKLKNLEQQSTASKEKIKLLKEQQEKLGKDKIGSAQWQKLQVEIEKTEHNLAFVDSRTKQVSSHMKEVADPKSVYNLNKALADTADELSTVNKELQVDPSNMEMLTKKTELEARQLKIAQEKAAGLASELQRLKNIDAGADEIRKAAAAAADAKVEVKQLEDSIKGMSDADLSNLEAMATFDVSEDLMNVADKVKDIGGSAIEATAEVQSAVYKITGYFGETGEKAEETESIFKEVFGTGLTSDMDKAAESIRLVKENLSGLSAGEISNVSQQVLALDENFGVDMSESLRGVNSLMTNFGLSAEESMDLLVAGTENGLNKTDELGDNLSEYAGKFKQAGFNEKEMFALLEDGLKGGAYNLDKVNDSINEMSTRLADGTIEDNLDNYSKKTQKLFEDWKKGGKTTQKDVFQSIIKDISNTENQQDKLNLAANAFGTMAEDGGVKFIEAMGEVNKTFDNTKGKADALQKSSRGISEQFESNKNNAGLLVAEYGEALAPMFEILTDTLNTIMKYLMDLPEPVKEVVGAIAIAIGVVTAITTAIIGVKIAITALSKVGLTFSPWIIAAVAAIAGIILIIKNWGKISEWFGKVWSKLKETVSNVVKKIKEKFSEMKQKVVDTVKGMGNGVKNFFKDMISKMLSIVSGIGGKIAGKFKGIVGKIKKALTGLKEIGKFIIDKIVEGITGFGGKIGKGIKGAIAKAAGFFKGESKGSKGFGMVKSFISSVPQVLKTVNTKLVTVGGASTSLNITVNANGQDAGELAKNVAKEVEKIIVRSNE